MVLLLILQNHLSAWRHSACHHLARHNLVCHHSFCHHFARHHLACQNLACHNPARHHLARQYLVFHHLICQYLARHHLVCHHLVFHHLACHHLACHHLACHYLAQHYLAQHYLACFNYPPQWDASVPDFVRLQAIHGSKALGRNRAQWLVWFLYLRFRLQERVNHADKTGDASRALCLWCDPCGNTLCAPSTIQVCSFVLVHWSILCSRCADI